MRTTAPPTVPRRGRPGTALAGSVLVVLAWIALAPPAGAAERVVLRLPLGAGLQAEIRADAALRLHAPGADEPALTAGLRAETPRRRAGVRPAPAHVGRASEGCPDGQRGLSEHADDDGDGRVDEDPLDGRDNDGDGRVDEDFAAVGDHMLAVDRGAAGGRVEFYRWAYPHLQPVVFAAPSAGRADAAVWHLETAGAPWIETDVRGLRHQVTGRAEKAVTHAYVTRLAGADGAWLALAVLDPPADDGTGRVLLDGRALEVRLGARPVATAVCVADTWLGLVHLLTEAAAVREGLADPVTGERVPWIAPPPCNLCRSAEPPAFRWRVDPQGHLVLAADLAPGALVQPDPDRFRVDGQPLGAPDRIGWIPAGGEETGSGWYAMSPARLARTGVGLADPYALLDRAGRHGARGTLEFLFRTPDPAVMTALTGGPSRRPADRLVLGSVGGPDVEAPLAVDPQAADPVRSGVALAAARETAPLPGDQARLLAGDASRLTLAPELLQGWPNPFQDVINLRFRVPSTVGEAFAWEKGDAPPPGLDLEAPVPWPGGQPQVTVKVYSVSGRELATLHEGSHLSGEVTVHWNGTDAFGRQVASGTYFCKLQMDDWSTTRRIVYVR